VKARQAVLTVNTDLPVAGRVQPNGSPSHHHTCFAILGKTDNQLIYKKQINTVPYVMSIRVAETWLSEYTVFMFTVCNM